MRKFKAVYMRGGTSKGIIFHRHDLPEREEWEHIFLQAMGSPDPKQIDGLGGTVSSNNKVVVVWKSDIADVDVEYLVGQVVVGKSVVDFTSNCGNMTAAVGPFAVEERIVDITPPVTTVRMLNRNTDKRIEVRVPIENGTFAQTGDCRIAGVDGTAAEVRVCFMNPAGSKTGKLLPTGSVVDRLDIPGLGVIEAAILDVSNPTVFVRARDIGLTATELPQEINQNKEACDILEKIRGTAACMMGFAKDLDEAARLSPAIPKVGFFAPPTDFTDISGKHVAAEEMDLCLRVISVFQCHKACPLTSAGSAAVSAAMENSIVRADARAGGLGLRIGHPSGILTMIPEIEHDGAEIDVASVAVLRTARRIMDGTVYIRS